MVKKLLSNRLPQRGTWVPLSKSESHHALRVLRMRDGEVVQAMDGEGGKISALLRVRDGKGFLEFNEKASVQEGLIAELPAKTQVSMEMAILKSEAMEWVVEKSVELGIHEFFPVSCTHSVTQIKTKGPEFFQQRWQKIADQALKQCGRSVRMLVHPPQELEALLTSSTTSVRFWCDEKKSSLPSELIPLLQSNLALSSGIRILVGPEGGWSITERELLARETGEKPHFYGVSLGNRILRAETAALFCMSVVSAWAALR